VAQHYFDSASNLTFTSFPPWSTDLFIEEQDSDLLSSDDDEVPFARHGPTFETDPAHLALQRDFWILCVIGFILDYRKFSVSHLQHIIDAVWRIRGIVSIMGRESYFYIFHFEYVEDLLHICNEGPWAVDGALLVLE